MRSGYGEKLRGYFSKHNPLILLDLGSGVFESATVDSNILLIKNNDNQEKTIALTINNSKEDLQKQTETAVQISFKTSEAWFIGSFFEIKIKNKIQKMEIF